MLSKVFVLNWSWEMLVRQSEKVSDHGQTSCANGVASTATSACSARRMMSIEGGEAVFLC